MFKNLKKQIEEETGVTPAPLVRTHHSLRLSSSGGTISTNDIFIPASQNSEKPSPPLKLEAVKPASRESMDMAELRNRYSSLEKVHDDYRTKTTELLAKKDSHISRLQNRISTLESRIEQLQGTDKLHSIVSERDMLQEKFRSLQSGYEQEKAGWDNQKKHLENCSTELKKRHEQELVELTKAKDKEMQKIIASCECDKLGNEIKVLRESLNECQDEMNTNRERNYQKETLHGQLGIVTAERDKLLKKMKGYEIERKRWLPKAELQTENMHLRVALDQTTDYFENMDIQSENEITSLSNQVEDLHEVINETKKDLHKLNNELNEKEHIVENLHQKVKVAESNSERHVQVVVGLRDGLDRSKEHCRDATKERDDLLLRNASLSHELELVKRQTGQERQDIHDQMIQLSTELDACKAKLIPPEEQGKLETVKELNSKIAELDENVKERDITIRLQQQRLSDIKKTLQKELKVHTMSASSSNLADSKFSVVGGSSLALDSLDQVHMNSVNFQYMKNVLLRFITSSDYEASQLIRAVSTILQLTSEEERLVWKTMRWKMSWLPISKPSLNHY